MSPSVFTTSNPFSCLPNTTGKSAACACTIFLIAAAALATLVFTQLDGNLAAQLLPIYATVGGFAILIFAVAALTACTNRTRPVAP